jgi:prepilin-type N-terminal cleavage/methylation domain-containing protein
MANKIYLKNKKGFTLVELIVVMSIISLLSSVVLANVNGYIIKARDVRRKVDLAQTKEALILYAAEHDSKLPTYPTSLFGWSDQGQGWATDTNGPGTCYNYTLEDVLAGTDPNTPAPRNVYIKMAHDPKCGGCGGCGGNPGGYMYYGGDQCAVLFAALENPSAADLNSCNGVCSGLDGLSGAYGMNYCVEVKLQ